MKKNVSAPVNRLVGRTYPEYLEVDDALTRIAKCIQFEILHGGNELAAARAIFRDIELGYIKINQPMVLEAEPRMRDVEFLNFDSGSSV